MSENNIRPPRDLFEQLGLVDFTAEPADTHPEPGGDSRPGDSDGGKREPPGRDANGPNARVAETPPPPFLAEWIDEHFQSDDQKAVLQRLRTGNEVSDNEIVKLVWGDDATCVRRKDDLKKLRKRICARLNKLVKEIGRLFTVSTRKRKWRLICCNTAHKAA
jgi:hypothetical protein